MDAWAATPSSSVVTTTAPGTNTIVRTFPALDRHVGPLIETLVVSRVATDVPTQSTAESLSPSVKASRLLAGFGKAADSAGTIVATTSVARAAASDTPWTS